MKTNSQRTTARFVLFACMVAVALSFPTEGWCEDVDAVAAPRGYKPADGMISWWPANGNAQDIVNGNPGMLLGGTTFAPGKFSGAFKFSSAGDFVQIDHDNSLNLESLPSTTYEGWFTSSGASASGGASVFAKHFCGVGTGWFFHTDEGCYIGDHFVGGSGLNGLDLDDGQFHHFACVKDGTTYQEYVDGILISEDTGPAVGTAVSDPVTIGGNFATPACALGKNQVFGLVDDVAIYHRALSESEIQAIFNSGNLSVTAPDPTATEAGRTTGRFTVRRHGSRDEDLEVNYQVSGTATPESDYTALGGSVTIPAGLATVKIVVKPTNDTVVECPETVVITLLPLGDTNPTTSASITIADNDLPKVTISALDAAASETGPDPGRFRVKRVGCADAPLTVHYTIGGTATPGADYPALDGSVTIPAAAIFATFNLVPVDDGTSESIETVALTLSSDAAYRIGSPNTATVFIESNE